MSKLTMKDVRAVHAGPLLTLKSVPTRNGKTATRINEMK